MIYKELLLQTQEKLIIREAQMSDAQNMIDYMNSILPESCFLSFEPWEFIYTVKEEKEIIKKYLESDNQIFLIAEIENSIVGMLNVSANNKNKMKHIGLMGISISEKNWWKKIWSHLIEEMLNWAKNNWVTRKINLVVNVSNSKAIWLYEKYHFETEGIIKRDMLINGEYNDARHMGILIN